MSEQLTKQEKRIYSTTEIAKLVRKKLKETYPNCKFSVVTQYYSGGSALHLSLMSSDVRIIKRFEDISEDAFNFTVDNRYSPEDMKKNQENGYHQLNQYQVLQDYNPNNWCNGVFLTEIGHKILQDAVKATEVYNWDNSDAMTDYSDVNFYLHLSIGQYNKEFIQGEK